MGGLPLVSLEADAYLSIGNKNGAFNQHAVGSQQGYLLIQAHVGKLIFQRFGWHPEISGFFLLWAGSAAIERPDLSGASALRN